jgi:hypothetical protein
VAVDECQHRKLEIWTSNPDYFLALIFPPNKTLIEYNAFHNFLETEVVTSSTTKVKVVQL